MSDPSTPRASSSWTAASAILRAMLVLFCGTFAGALVLPVSAHGTLPLTWAEWRQPLAAAFTSAIVAELAFARAHLSQLAKAMGLMLLACVIACNGPVFPQIDAVERVVAKDLAEGRSDSQIASDVCAVLGGRSTTDAVCADVELVVADTIRLLTTSGVLSGPALTRAHGWLGAHPGLCRAD
jgi:hypothetical protein